MATPFYGQYSCRRGTYADPGLSTLGLLIFQLKPMVPPPTHQSDRSRWCRRRRLGNIRFTVGQYSCRRGTLCRSGSFQCRLSFQLEANGSATYLTKVTAPDGTATDYFGSSVSQSGNIPAAAGAYWPTGDFPRRGHCDLFNGSATAILNKVTASDGAAGDKSRSSGNIRRGHTMPIRISSRSGILIWWTF